MNSHTHIHSAEIECELSGQPGHEHHEGRSHKSQKHEAKDKQSNLRLAAAATLHCLLGCGLGEIIGVIIGTALGLGMWQTMGLAVVLGFILGFALGIIPLARAGMPFAVAFKVVLVAEGLSIAVMEAAEVLVQIFTPGVMEAGLMDWLFWGGMLVSLAAGFVAAFPVNVILIGRGIRHHH